MDLLSDSMAMVVGWLLVGAQDASLVDADGVDDVGDVGDGGVDDGVVGDDGVEVDDAGDDGVMLASCRCHDDGDVRDDVRDDAGVDGVDERGVGWGVRVRCMLWEVRCVSA